MTLVDVIEENYVKTRISGKDNVREFETEIEPQLALLETLIPALQKNMPEILKEQVFEFTLYLPLIAFELKSKYFLPFDISQLDMTAVADKFLRLDSAAGKIPAVRIVITPDSRIIRSLLPEKRKEFKFVFGAEPPYWLLIFEDNRTQTILTEIQFPDKTRQSLDIKPL